ncbi:MAG: galactose-1-phosphate uridylyltransferase, partial [Clostridia bacterium]|nr:galactose-1-phosphate uridylyltransferase [Clostridia bacterium]
MICKAIGSLIDYALKKDLIVECDIYVVRNYFMDLLGVEEWTEPEDGYEDKSIDDILKVLIDYAVEKGIIKDTANSRDLFDTALMGIVTPMPREVMEMFYGFYYIDVARATEFYYELNKDLNYVRAGRMSRDKKWKYNSEYGMLDITINLSKPEKDPRDIAMLANQKSASYPKCQLCPENMGYAGRADHPARQNLRPISFEVEKENWFFQYSPYGYYNEHCIFFNEKHIPMKIDRAVFYKLCDIIDFLPHYFVGSNADLPIVGGSILTHEHFQGGKYTFAMET